MRKFEIFKPGTHTAASGATLSFSEADLAATVAAYDPAVHEAPIVVGHPRDNGPAYGWVKKLEFSEGALVAHADELDPEFAEMVKAGRFKKRSASFYAPDSKANPKPGVFYLRHVGFLGAQPPAVKGLKDVPFAEDDEGVVEFQEDWVVAGILARLFGGLRDFMLATYGQEKADQVIPKYAVEDLAQHARDIQPKAEQAIPSFSEDPHMTLTPDQISELQAKAKKADELQAELDKTKADLAKTQADFAELKKAQDLATIKAAIEPHVKAGKVLPAEVDQLANFAATLDDGEATFDFGEGEQAKKLTARGLFLAQLAQRAKVVEFGEAAPKARTEGEPDLAELQRKIRAQVAGAAQ